MWIEQLLADMAKRLGTSVPTSLLVIFSLKTANIGSFIA